MNSSKWRGLILERKEELSILSIYIASELAFLFYSNLCIFNQHLMVTYSLSMDTGRLYKIRYVWKIMLKLGTNPE